MTLASFTVDNYRSFADPTLIELRPLTLLFGYNSAGKSSLLRALPLLAASCSPGTTTPLALGSALVRGASFGDLCSRMSDRRELRFGLTWRSPSGEQESLALRIREIESRREQVVEQFKIDGEEALEALWEPEEDVTNGSRYVFSSQEGRTVGMLDFEGLVPSPRDRASIGVFASGTIERVGVRLRDFAAALHWLGPLRAAPPRTAPYVSRPRSIGASGDEAARIIAYDLLNNGPLLRTVSSWYEGATKHRLELLLEAERFKAAMSRLDAPHAQIPLVDTGEGMVQVLPVLVLAAQALHGQLGEAPILAIEHPELHLHPAAEQELAALFTKLAADQPTATSILETHSPIFLSRVQLAIVRGEIPRESVVVYWVREGDDGRSVADKITFDELARPTPMWPPSVFSEELEQARAIMEERSKKVGQ